jgi:hypothetical protein
MVAGRVRDDSRGYPIRSAAVVILVSVVISVLAFTATVAFWMDRSAGREAAFRSNAAEVLAMDSSQEALAARLMDEAIGAVPLLALVRGAGEQAIIVLLDSGAFDVTMDRLAAEAHRHVVSQTDGPFTADLTDVREILVAPIARISPDLAARIPVDVFEDVMILDSGALPILGTTSRWLPWIATLSAAAAVFLAVSLVMLTRRRSTALIGVGLAVAAAGVGVIGWSRYGGGLVTGRFTDELTRVLVTNATIVVGHSLGSAGSVLTVLGSGIVGIGLVSAAVSASRSGRGESRT